ncbi:hypothetical protein HK100_008937, partial [Physocladia obscura]
EASSNQLTNNRQVIAERFLEQGLQLHPAILNYIVPIRLGSSPATWQLIEYFSTIIPKTFRFPFDPSEASMLVAHAGALRNGLQALGVYHFKRFGQPYDHAVGQSTGLRTRLSDYARATQSEVYKGKFGRTGK